MSLALTPGGRDVTLCPALAAMITPAHFPAWIAALLLGSGAACAADSDLAVAIVYDTSGSMKDAVAGRGGVREPKYVVASRALAAIVEKLEKVNAAGPRQVQCGLFTFRGNGGQETVKLGPLDAPALRKWLASLSKPEGGTPIGGAVSDATKALWKIRADSRHVLVITDGENTVGAAPDAVLPRLQDQCLKNGLVVHFHFLAFDVDAKVFGGIKQFGATLVGASDEAQLNQKLNFILEEKILLEKE